LLFTNCFWPVSNRCWRIWYRVASHQWSWRIRWAATEVNVLCKENIFMLYNCTGFVDVYLQVAGVYCHVGSHKIALNTIIIVADKQIGPVKLKNRRSDPLHDILDAVISQKLPGIAHVLLSCITRCVWSDERSKTWVQLSCDPHHTVNYFVSEVAMISKHPMVLFF